MSIGELCSILTKDEQTFNQCDPEERDQYEMKMKNEWRTIFSKYLKYKDPHIENEDIQMSFDNVFVYVDFMKPGRHSYIVNSLGGDQ